MPRRRGRPGLVGTMARTAVVTGTATAVHGGMTRRQQGKQQAAYEQEAANQAAFEAQQQLAQMQAQQAAAAAAAPAPAPAAPQGDLMAELQKLADMKAAGILSEDEFTAAKAKLLS